MTARVRGAVVFALALGSCAHARGPLTPVRPGEARGPLRVSSANPRYFADDSGRVVYLTGSHTWSSLQDNGPSDPPPAFDYTAYLDTLVAYNHDFFRLYAWEQGRWTDETSGDYWITPLPWVRTGPGLALDGKPRWNLTRFNPEYFARLHDRVAAAGRRGIYVSVMLFNGWSIEAKGDRALNDPWRGHPFNASNNVNGIDGHLDPFPAGSATHSLRLPRVLAIQEEYVRHVVDAVNDLDNVLYEISNESAPTALAWQNHMVNLIHDYERTKPKQHPVGMTAMWPGGSNGDLFASAADWISPGDADGYATDPPAGDGRKVVILDTDHLGTEHTRAPWVWKSFLRGLNPIFMDSYDGKAVGLGARPDFDPRSDQYVQVRRAMGYTMTLATELPMGAMTPQGARASTHYCLADTVSGIYLVYLPDGGSATVDLAPARRRLAVDWFSPTRDALVSRGSTTAGGQRPFTAPFSGDAVLYIH